MHESVLTFAERCAEAVASVRPGDGPALLRGIADDPEMLFSWEQLNRILRATELDWAHPHMEDCRARYRIALYRNGTMVDPARLFRRVTTPRGTRSYRLDVAVLSEELRVGGSFVVRDLDRDDEVVATIASALEARLQAPVMGGVFAAWGDGTGIDLHWDEMDNVAVQICGTRLWELWQPSVPNPIAGMDLERPDRPADLVLTLRAGDGLYFPRGWWHRPEGLGDPALHLTFGIYRRTGLDLLRWLCARTRCTAEGTVLFDRDLREPWTGAVIDEFFARERECSRGEAANRLTFDLPATD